MPKRPATELELALDRSLYRNDKWDPARDREQPSAWEPRRDAYVDVARRLLRTFEKDGLSLMMMATTVDE